MIGFDATDHQVAMLRAMARKLRTAAPLTGDELAEQNLDLAAMVAVEGNEDWRDLKSNRSRYADR